MAKYKVTGKISHPLGTVTASKLVEANSEDEAKSKVREKWQISYGEILQDGSQVEGITVKAI